MSIIKIEDLNKGDEVLIACNADFRRVIVTRQPRINPKKQWGKYSSIMCDILNEHDLTDYNVKRTMYQDLNYRQIWLLKKANE